MNQDKHVHIPIITRVEGEAALQMHISNGSIASLQLQIYEPPRFFEKMLEGRNTQDLLDIISRICGLCPVAYQMSAVQAVESIFGLCPSAWVKGMRRLFYCGEWLQNHSLHIHMLALPDYLGFDSLLTMAKDYPEEVKRGLRLQKLGNDLIALLGARSVHPVGTVIGGFSSAPAREKVKALLERLQPALDDAYSILRWLCKLELPEYSHEFISVAMSHPTEYPMVEGRIVSDKGLDIRIDQFDTVFKEEQVTYSNALKCSLNGEAYLVGPLARLNLHFKLLPHDIQSVVRELGFTFPTKNMFMSIIARAIEMILCLHDAIQILQNYDYPDKSYESVALKAGVGFGCTEAPRGLLWHRYQLDEHGLIQSARIIPPTSQNQARIEADLQYSLKQFGLNKSEIELRFFSERVIRNYDPCISCSTHFLTLSVEKT